VNWDEARQMKLRGSEWSEANEDAAAPGEANDAA